MNEELNQFCYPTMEYLDNKDSDAKIKVNYFSFTSASTKIRFPTKILMEKIKPSVMWNRCPIIKIKICYWLAVEVQHYHVFMQLTKYWIFQRVLRKNCCETLKGDLDWRNQPYIISEQPAGLSRIFVSKMIFENLRPIKNLRPGRKWKIFSWKFL